MTPVKRILLVDDEAPLRQSLAEQLRLHDGFETEEAETAAQALAMVRNGHFDAILIGEGSPGLIGDGPPGLDGQALCRLIRGEGVRSPVILLTAAGAPPCAPAGLDEAGATECLARPFRLGVLLTRLRTLLRQFEQTEDAELAIGPYRFRPAVKQLVDAAAGRTIRLTEKEAAILRYLLRAGAKVTGRDELLGAVWGYNAGVDTHTLETHVYRLRQKLEADPANARILITEPGGYRLVT